MMPPRAHVRPYVDERVLLTGATCAFPGLCRQAGEVDRVLSAALSAGIVGFAESRDAGQGVQGHCPQRGGLVSVVTMRRDGKRQDPVKALVQDRFGPPDVLQLADIGLPEVGAGDVLVRVHAAALNPADWHILRGDPLVARLMGVGLTRPKAQVAGIDAARIFGRHGPRSRSACLAQRPRILSAGRSRLGSGGWGALGASRWSVRSRCPALPRLRRARRGVPAVRSE